MFCAIYMWVTLQLIILVPVCMILVVSVFLLLCVLHSAQFNDGSYSNWFFFSVIYSDCIVYL